MDRQGPTEAKREPRTERIGADFCVVGGGLAGVCAAVAAARAGLRVALIQDRPVLGGNASSEVRLWVLGATAHLHTNNRWAREGGVVDELLVENLHRNPEGNPLVFDTVLLERVTDEPGIVLLLNTAVYDIEKTDAETIGRVRAFCSQNATRYEVEAPLFCDASGDGILGFLAGAAFRMGAESAAEFGEPFAPSREYGELLGHSLYFYSKDVGRPVRFVPPHYALADITRIPRFRHFNAQTQGCRLWWVEFGGRLDTVHDTETIKWELWKVVYGVWNHIKNSGLFPEAETLTLEWVGAIPGKRESRRFEGDAMLTQTDVVGQRAQPDAVSYGGWSIDLHPADGVYADHPCGCDQWHPRGVYPIPYRCLYSRNIANLFLAGRLISVSHVAFGSTRVMATGAHNAQAVGLAAAQCRARNCRPREVDAARLQQDLLRAGQYIPGVRGADPADLARAARRSATSRLRLAGLPGDGPWLALDTDWAQMLPLPAGPAPRVTFEAEADGPAELELELRVGHRPDGHTPETVLARRAVALAPGVQEVAADFDAALDQDRYGFFCLLKNERVRVRTTERRVTGLVTVARSGAQRPPPEIGVPAFAFWAPRRRPEGRNLALRVDPPLDGFGPDQVANGLARPTAGANAWVADPGDPRPRLTLSWDGPRRMRRIELAFDTDFDHPMESVQMGHPERVMPFCVRRCAVRDGAGRLLAELRDNHQTRRTLDFGESVETDRLDIELEHPSALVPAALFEVRVYA